MTLSFGIIPARYESIRFPGKPLALIHGRPMFWHVYQRAVEADCFQGVCLATDDARIFDCAKGLSVPVVMTAREHPSGTDRILEAARNLKVSGDAVVVNIQGDEPALDPAMIRQVLHPFETKPHTQVSTLARRVERSEAESPDIVKVVMDATGRARYFSRALIPHYRGSGSETYLAHVGLYAYRMKTLIRFSDLGPSRLEKKEKLEQLRLLENGIEIQVSITTAGSIGVDRPTDIPLVEKLLETL